MSLKRGSSSSNRGSSFGGGADPGAKVDRQEMFDELKKHAASGISFTPVDVALAIGAGEPQVSKAMMGLAIEGYLEKVEVGRYRSVPMSEMSQAEFLKAFARASKVDGTRQRDLSEIGRLKQNNDTMRQRLLAAIAERDHYLSVLKARGIDPGPVPVAAAAAAEPAPAPAVPASPPPPAVATPPVTPPAPESAAPGPDAMASPSPTSEPAPSGPGDSGGGTG